MRHVAPVALALIVLGASGCAVSRDAARDRAAAHACDRVQACGSIGSGGLYATQEDCEVQQQSFWTDYWPASGCEGRISADDLDYCLESIDRAACGVSLDLWTTLSACQESKVCSGR